MKPSLFGVSGPFFTIVLWLLGKSKLWRHAAANSVGILSVGLFALRLLPSQSRTKMKWSLHNAATAATIFLILGLRKGLSVTASWPMPSGYC